MGAQNNYNHSIKKPPCQAPALHSLKDHAEDDRPSLVTDGEAVLVEVQQLGLQQLGLTERCGVVAPRDDGSQHQHTAEHTSHHQGPAIPTKLLLQWGAGDPFTGVLVPLTPWYYLVHPCGSLLRT